MTAFHEAHLSKLATDHFQAHFLRPDHPPADATTYNEADEEEYYEEEDDGLGYYPDGVKRTLTDEQIAIFRHSEIEALRRARESSSTKNTALHKEDAAHDTSEEGEVSSSTPSATAKKSKKRKRGKSKNNKTNNNNGTEPVDLRKRTWDVVDKGLATLDYGEEDNKPVEASAIQRRRISYDD